MKVCNSGSCDKKSDTIYGLCTGCWDRYNKLMNFEMVLVKGDEVEPWRRKHGFKDEHE